MFGWLGAELHGERLALPVMRTAVIGGQPRHLTGWKPSKRKLGAARPDIDLASLPTKFELAGFPTDYDQEQLNSCGPNALAECFEFLTGGKKFSRLFAYWWTRAIEGDIDQDAGITIDDLMTIAASMGLPLEELWPYDIGQFEVRPPVDVLIAALAHRVTQQDVIEDVDHVLYALATYQKPVLLGFWVPSSMQDGSGLTASTGVVDVPTPTNPVIGGHAVTAMGYDRERGLVKTTSHYGSSYGDGGCLWLPYAMWASGNVCDARAVRAVS